jgi:hypothetical protein
MSSIDDCLETVQAVQTAALRLRPEAVPAPAPFSLYE